MWLGVCSRGVRSSIYIFYNRCMCSLCGAMCSINIMFSIYIIYSICSDNMGIEVFCVLMLFGSWVGIIMWAGGWGVCALEGYLIG